MKVDQVPVWYEKRRHCGFRRPGGLYLVAGAPCDCSKLPIPLHQCPVCSGGLKHSRGWTWIQPDPFTKPEPHGGPKHSSYCPLAEPGGLGNRAGLLWVGAQFYEQPEDFFAEAKEQGISRRIARVPRGFKIGETWVLLAHIHGVSAPYRTVQLNDDDRMAAIFAVFKPKRIEYVVRGDESEQELDAMIERGITPIRVIPNEQQQPLFE